MQSSLSQCAARWPEKRGGHVIPFGSVQGEPVPVTISVLDQGLRTGLGKEQARMPPVIKDEYRHRIRGVGRWDDRSGAAGKSGGSYDGGHNGRCYATGQLVHAHPLCSRRPAYTAQGLGGRGWWWDCDRVSGQRTVAKTPLGRESAVIPAPARIPTTTPPDAHEPGLAFALWARSPFGQECQQVGDSDTASVEVTGAGRAPLTKQRKQVRHAHDPIDESLTVPRAGKGLKLIRPHVHDRGKPTVCSGPGTI